MDPLTVGVEDLEWIDIEHESDVGRVRRAAGTLAQRLGFSEHRRGEVTLAISELATNLYRHAVGGTVVLRVRRRSGSAAVEGVFIDRGPGITDLDAVSRDGFSSRGTLGLGIGAVMRLASSFDCHSVVGKGTVASAVFWDAHVENASQPVQGLTRGMSGEMRCGDAWACASDGAITQLMLADGLGHGELAAIAASAAVDAFEAARGLSVAEIMRRINTALRSTRGAAVAIVAIDEKMSAATFCGIGNVNVWFDGIEGRKGLASAPGIAGAYTKQPRELSVELKPRTTVVMHSDGLTPKWDLQNYPGIRGRDPLLVAATLLRDAGVRHDDASVVVMRTP